MAMVPIAISDFLLFESCEALNLMMGLWTDCVLIYGKSWADGSGSGGILYLSNTQTSITLAIVLRTKSQTPSHFFSLKFPVCLFHHYIQL